MTALYNFNCIHFLLGEKPYACAVCPRAFNQRVVLREHVRSHHSGPDTIRGTSMKHLQFFYFQI